MSTVRGRVASRGRRRKLSAAAAGTIVAYAGACAAVFWRVPR